MDLQKLLDDGTIKRFEASKEEIDNCLLLAERDLATAEKMLSTNTDWCFNIAYNAFLQAARAWMLYKGYRPGGEAAHKAVAEFLQTTTKEFKEKAALFDMMRKKRHRAVYDEPGIISRYEAEQAVESAREFLKTVREKIR